MERVEIAELFYNALIDFNNLENLARFLSPEVRWTLAAANPQTAGEESPRNAINFFGKEGCRQLALYFRESLKVFSGELTGFISHSRLVLIFGRVRLRSLAKDQVSETNIAARLTFHGFKIIKGQIRISRPLVFQT
jgi:hypothetical protein